jgi:hypothetical protein
MRAQKRLLRNTEALHYEDQGDVRVSKLDPSPSRHPTLDLQNRIGNRAIQRLIQTKMRIGSPDDEYEREADRIADLVMRMPEPGIQRKPT